MAKHVNQSIEIAQIVEDVKKDLYLRQLERKGIENQWLINLNFIAGNQYLQQDSHDIDFSKRFYWEEKKVYNHISGILEHRIAKLCSIKPKIMVVPASADSTDLASARTCQSICDALWHKDKLSKVITRATTWSEACGTAFYKITWNKQGGDLLELSSGEKASIGEVKIDAISPFEIYPQSLSCEELEDNASIIHARAVDISKIKDMYGIDVEGENLPQFTIKQPIDKYSANLTNADVYSFSNIDKKASSALVIEKYILPNSVDTDGRLIIVCGDYLVYDGKLPYINGVNGKRGYPFVKQVSFNLAGSFYGTSVVERLIPLQKDYNALKNRKIEFLNRISMGVVLAEDGAVDIESLEDEGLEPGKIIVYRQGSTPPTFMPSHSVPLDFQEEEIRLQSEFSSISGVSDLLSRFDFNVSNISGTALQIILEQENSKLAITTDSINQAVCDIATQILRLYKQFATLPRVMNIVGDKGGVDSMCFSSADITTQDVIIDTQSETISSPAQQRSTIFEILNSGLLQEDDGKLNRATRQKLIEMLGLGIYDMSGDITALQVKQAQKENLIFEKGKEVKVKEIDDHELHIHEHTCYLLSNESASSNDKIYNKVLEHIREHKKFEHM